MSCQLHSVAALPSQPVYGGEKKSCPHWELDLNHSSVASYVADQVISD
jgi:hypothetical protein